MNTMQSIPSTTGTRKPDTATLADLLRQTAYQVEMMGNLLALPGLAEFEPQTICYPASSGAAVLMPWIDAMRSPQLRVYAGAGNDVCVEVVGEYGPALVPIRIVHPIEDARPYLMSSDVPEGESRSLPVAWLREYAHPDA